MSVDCKATVNLGEYSRGGYTRGDNKAADHDMGCQQKHTPFGILNEDSGELFLSFGSSAKTSDFIVDSFEACWNQLSAEQREEAPLLLIKVDNGSESNGRRTQFLARMVAFADDTGKPIQLLYYPHTTASTIQSNAAEGLLRNTGTAPNSSILTPCSRGRRP